MEKLKINLMNCLLALETITGEFNFVEPCLVIQRLSSNYSLVKSV